MPIQHTIESSSQSQETSQEKEMKDIQTGK
jgi:hypothetical protein